MPTTRHVNAVIFDYDGVIGDSEKFFDFIVQEYAQHLLGHQFDQTTFKNLRAKMFGRTGLDAARILHRTMGITHLPLHHYLEWRAPILKTLLPQTQLMPGARRLITHLRHHHIPIAVATSATRHDFNLKTTTHRDIIAYFGRNIITAEDVTQKKPHPQIFLLAAQQLNTTPRQSLVIEDAPSGVAAAKAAGAFVVAVPHPLLDLTLVASADQIIKSLDQFQPELWGLPPLTNT